MVRSDKLDWVGETGSANAIKSVDRLFVFDLKGLLVRELYAVDHSAEGSALGLAYGDRDVFLMIDELILFLPKISDTVDS